MTPSRDAIRRAMRAARRRIAPAERAAASRRFAALADRAFLLRPGSRIGVYLAHGHEADVRCITERAWKRRCMVYVPVITARRRARMEFFRFEPTTALYPNAFGIPEPDPRTTPRIAVRHLDVIFMPLVAFDERGWRLGSGVGFYDRCLQHLHTLRRWRRPKLVGVAYAQQHVPELTPSPWDIPMDAVLTQHYFKRFNPLQLGTRP